MFKLYVPITKSRRVGNILEIEGLASNADIDRDNERMTKEAVEAMSDSVNKGNIPIRVEHENKLYSEVGVWKSATMVEDKMYVKGELDLEFSLAKDAEVLLRRNIPLGLSIGGTVLDAGIEFVQNLGKSIRVYKNILLKEISLTKNPAVAESILSIAKSFDAEKQTQTPEALELEKHDAEMKKVTEEELKKASLEEIIGEENFQIVNKGMYYGGKGMGGRKKKIKKTFDELVVDMAAATEKVIDKCDSDFCDCAPCAPGCYNKMTSDDIKLVTILTQVVSSVELDGVVMPKELQDWEFVDSLPQECFVVEISGKYMPHHNPDFSINNTWLPTGCPSLSMVIILGLHLRNLRLP